MSFMDKAKKMAEQAQQKLEEAQKQFNERQVGGGGVGSGQAPHREQSSSSAEGPDQTPPRFDEHGRPIPAEPASAAPQGGEQSEAAPAPADAPNANPDPFKPLGS